jgi:hypothetical protein
VPPECWKNQTDLVLWNNGLRPVAVNQGWNDVAPLTRCRAGQVAGVDNKAPNFHDKARKRVGIFQTAVRLAPKKPRKLGASRFFVSQKNGKLDSR